MLKTHRQGGAQIAEHDRTLKVCEGGEGDIARVTCIDAALQEDVDIKRNCIHHETRDFFVVELVGGVSVLISRDAGNPE